MAGETHESDNNNNLSCLSHHPNTPPPPPVHKPKVTAQQERFDTEFIAYL